MGKKEPQIPRNGKTDKPPAPPPFQRLTTPSKWVAPMSAATPSFRRQKVCVPRAPEARDEEAAPEAPNVEPVTQTRTVDPAVPPVESPAPSAPEPEATEPVVEAEPVEPPSPEPAPSTAAN